LIEDLAIRRGRLERPQDGFHHIVDVDEIAPSISGHTKVAQALSIEQICDPGAPL
jgi:hypothetical protein